jgi:hypothetical protein
MSQPVSFSALKRSRGSIEKLTAAIQQASQGRKEDERFWEPTVDKAGNGHAIIRFLPAPPIDGEDGLPWVRSFSHGFQGPGGWFIDLCPTTLGQKCPVCEGNNTLWNSGIEANKAIARARKRKLSYTANILIISDPAKPENDGKVKLYRFGTKIFDKINEKMRPEFPDEVAFSPFDLWDGANFRLKIRKVEGYRNYDKSEFMPQSVLFAEDEKSEAIWKSEFSLKELVDPKLFKTYAQLESRKLKVLGAAQVTTTAEDLKNGAFNDEDAGIQAPATTNDPVAPSPGGDEDDDLKFFKSLADEE